MPELPRVLAFLFLASVVGLLEIAAARAFRRAFRELREDIHAWRERRADRRTLRAYEAEVAELDKAWRGEP
ncbi:hypothetical protein [Nonomuraea angiospora]|uniref:hypothetical protein n=1 Tax=Nonomuraea angiospora TaxID=46172 RepID=UPI0029B617E7|nr:hypothetical protein [Nonomuraea angiospora]MDX3109709.1 hypothetical protein [Nonomuraea angiospora]